MSTSSPTLSRTARLALRVRAPRSGADPAAEPAVAGRPRMRRTRLTVAAAVTGLLCSAGLATAGGLLPDPVPETYAGSYALFHGNQFVGRIHSVKGCRTDVQAIRAPNGDIASRPAGAVPCKFLVGLQMHADFRQDVTNVITGKTARMREYTVGRVSGGVVTSGIQFTGLVGDVKLPGMRAGTAPTNAWIEVELLNVTGRYTKAKNFDGAVPAGSAGVPIEASMPGIALAQHVTATGFAGVDPIAIDHRERFGPDGQQLSQGTPSVGESRLRVHGNATATVNALETWHEAHVDGTAGAVPRTLTLRYRDAAGTAGFELTLSGLPTQWDPIERTDGLRIAGMAFKETPVSATW